mmetsp:Transcript_49510/g.152803  ORF Transcript_49510/g.152803 Transcript_49510/m.152803 type:complete len:342 (+) Transcript_49510:417-1442(+)
MCSGAPDAAPAVSHLPSNSRPTPPSASSTVKTVPAPSSSTSVMAKVSGSTLISLPLSPVTRITLLPDSSVVSMVSSVMSTLMMRQPWCGFGCIPQKRRHESVIGSSLSAAGFSVTSASAVMRKARFSMRTSPLAALAKRHCWFIAFSLATEMISGWSMFLHASAAPLTCCGSKLHQPSPRSIGSHFCSSSFLLGSSATFVPAFVAASGTVRTRSTSSPSNRTGRRTNASFSPRSPKTVALNVPASRSIASRVDHRIASSSGFSLGRSLSRRTPSHVSSRRMKHLAPSATSLIQTAFPSASRSSSTPSSVRVSASVAFPAVSERKWMLPSSTHTSTRSPSSW